MAKSDQGGNTGAPSADENVQMEDVGKGKGQGQGKGKGKGRRSVLVLELESGKFLCLKVKINPSLVITFRNQHNPFFSYGNHLQTSVFIWLYLLQIMSPEAHPRTAHICNDLLVALYMHVYRTFHPKDFMSHPGHVKCDDINP